VVTIREDLVTITVQNSFQTLNRFCLFLTKNDPPKWLESSRSLQLKFTNCQSYGILFSLAKDLTGQIVAQSLDTMSVKRTSYVVLRTSYFVLWFGVIISTYIPWASPEIPAGSQQGISAEYSHAPITKLLSMMGHVYDYTWDNHIIMGLKISCGLVTSQLNHYSALYYRRVCVNPRMQNHYATDNCVLYLTLDNKWYSYLLMYLLYSTFTLGCTPI
jgi:hypothetical protein